MLWLGSISCSGTRGQPPIYVLWELKAQKSGTAEEKTVQRVKVVKRTPDAGPKNKILLGDQLPVDPKEGRNLLNEHFGLSKGEKFRYFNEDRYRDNFTLLTKLLKGADFLETIQNWEAHHLFPQKYRKDFARLGINVDDPRFFGWMSKEVHNQLHHAEGPHSYNIGWKEVLDKNLTRAEIIHEMHKTIQKHHLEVISLSS